MSALAARNVFVWIGRVSEEIVCNASLSLNAGELVVMVGPNGAGKTTLLRALAGLIPAEGTITIGEKPLNGLSPRERARAIAYLPQGHTFHWPMSVESIVMLGRAPHSDSFSIATADDRAAVAQALETTETTKFAQRPVTTLSGGEKARVALARALATQAPILLADEPTTSLDPRHQLTVMTMLRRAADSGSAILAIMHDLALAARFADRVLMINYGAIVADAAPAVAFSPELLDAVFGIEAAMVQVDNKPVPIPGRALW